MGVHHIWVVKALTFSKEIFIGPSRLIYMEGKALIGIIHAFFWILISGKCYATENDIRCLKLIKQSVTDPQDYIKNSWDFSNTTEGSICNFIGVECWHPGESKVLNLKLPSLGLHGGFPLGLEYCTSITGLDLSDNKFSGLIPSNISAIVKYVTSLDLSYNSFTGQIPEDLGNCSFLNVLHLQHNQLNGTIPWQLGGLDRLTVLNVADNSLSGNIPAFNKSFQLSRFANNPGLCGKPLADCKGKQKTNVAVIASSMIGALLTIVVITIIIIFWLRKIPVKKRKEKDAGNKWAKSFKRTKGIKVSMFEKSVSIMKLSDLMQATNDFSSENIIGTGRTGTMYKALLPDGTSLAVKRLQDSQHTSTEFSSEMATLGSVQHKNLVPLLGYCIAEKEKLLVYKHMSKGTLYDLLHNRDAESKHVDWPLRLRIGIGAAKGLAWLHHNCNPRILHRNISSKCILLDEDYEPRISDFGLARLMNPVDTHLSTFVNGEFGDLGYVAPEYSRTLVATPKGDVYSFGVVLLELVAGERPTQVSNAPDNFRGSLVEWITFLSNNSLQQDAIDKSLIGKDHDGELLQVLKVACSCVVPAHKERPTMFEVYQLLRAIGERYHFTVDDEILLPDQSTDAGNLDELIVSR